jgi:hypothetical protein
MKNSFEVRTEQASFAPATHSALTRLYLAALFVKQSKGV